MSDMISRSTTASKIAGLTALAIILVLIAAPFWGSVATERLIGEFMVYLALATLWNLLAGYTGLVPVGQQAFVGFGAYIVFSLALLAGWNPLYAVPMAGIATAIIAIPVAALVFRLQGAYFAIGTWVVAEVFRLLFAQLSILGGGSGKSMPADVVKQIAETKFWREATIYWVALTLGIGALAWIAAVSCGAPLMKLPDGPGTPVTSLEAAYAYTDATELCARPRAMSADVFTEQSGFLHVKVLLMIVPTLP